jgi:hypothetical protein
MTQRVFTSDDQIDFAGLSGDFNPLHMDPVYARRLMFGKQVVHGLHTLLWSLDNHLQSYDRPLELKTVKADFKTGIGVGQTVACRYDSEDNHNFEIHLEADGTPTAWFQLALKPSGLRGDDSLPGPPQEQGVCRELAPGKVAVASGRLDLYVDRKKAGRLFPHLSRLMPSRQLAALLAITRLVGMECPGLHSIFSGLQLNFDSNQTGPAELAYRVTTCNEQLALALMEIEGHGINGRIKAFLRPQAHRQAAFSKACRHVESDEFSDQKALVIGGSRGLGEVAAKLLAAGGAEVIVTYYHGQKDAQHIVDDMISHGARATCHFLDVLETSPEIPCLTASGSKPLYLYYFATPSIFGGARGEFSPRRFAGFVDYYVRGFLRIVQCLTHGASGLQKIFYPSSAAIDELPLAMGEYAAAKIAGETLCDFLQKTSPGLIIHKPRLPRIATDQTVSLLPVDNQDPISILLQHLRALRQL